MTIWFSTNIPEMRAISTFKRVSTDIGNIQERITTGQRINSGKDDPGGLIVREALRADIKSIHATQAGMMQAESQMDIATSGMLQLLEILQGPDLTDPSNGGLLGALYAGTSDESTGKATTKAAAQEFMKLYDSVVASTKYNNAKLLEGLTKTYQLGGGETLSVALASQATTGGTAAALNTAVEAIASDATITTAITAAEALVTTLSEALGTLGNSQKIVATNQSLLDSRLTNVAAAEGRISNADIAIESSRMARAELLAQNAMSSIMYTRNYAAFAVSSLFR